jgi:DNA-binding response OmpR family regulator
VKTILTADWYLPEICNLLAMQVSGRRSIHVAQADDADEAVSLLPAIKPDLVISQPSLLMGENSKLFQAVLSTNPVPKLLVWWGCERTRDDLALYVAGSMDIHFVEIPCHPSDLTAKIERLVGC